jgi:two-component system NarL family sensor kinase
VVLPAVTVLLALYPDGRTASPRWRPLVPAAVAGMVLVAVGSALAPGTMRLDARTSTTIDNPLGVRGPLPGSLTGVAAVVLAGVAVLSLVSLVLRWRASRGLERQQLKVLAVGAGAALLLQSLPLGSETNLGQFRYLLVPVVLFGSIGVALLRYRLYDVDVVLRRAVVYAALTGLVLVTYAGTLVIFTRLLGPAPSSAALVVASVVVAVGLEPTRRAVQRAVNRALYGQRDEPMAALSALRDRMEAVTDPGELLPAMAEVVAAALRAPYVSVQLQHGHATKETARVGEPGLDAEHLPLLFQRERVGTLVVGFRARGESFGRNDRALLDEVAARAGAVAYAIRIAEDLDEARQLATSASAEERRRLRRDLHDGLGPLLVGAGLTVEGLRRVTPPTDPSAAGLCRVAEQVHSATAEVRRILDALRPGALDDLGLIEAIREHLLRLSGSGPVTTLDAADVGSLPAAVEQAAYLVVLEGVTNVVRHARAERCTVTVRRHGDVLHVAVADDGCGIAQGYVSGVGIASMRARTSEVGGVVTIGPGELVGTRLHARLPILGASS